MPTDTDAFDRRALASAIRGMCDVMLGSIEEITDADRAIGDGDHGLAISRGFRAAREVLDEPGTDVGELFEAIGRAMLTSMGGAAGPIYGTLFQRGGRALRGRSAFGSEALAVFLEGGLAGVQERGGAKVGDKTIVDALQPAAAAARAAATRPFGESIAAVVEAAEAGLERTRELQAMIGKARALGDRSIGHLDPGALSFTLMIRGLAQSTAETTDNSGSNPT
ncbi:MAG: dihydroxyacetone kinase subunit DhaL [Aeromicrobium sp.]